MESRYVHSISFRKKKKCIHGSVLQQCSIFQQQNEQLKRRFMIKKQKSNGMFLDKPQVFLNVNLEKIICFVKTVCFYLENPVLLISNGLSLNIK